MQYKGKHIDPYESFYWDVTDRFNRGQLGGGISRTVKTTDSLAVMVITNVVAVGRQRTEEEKARRRIHGDKGAKFSQGKELCLLGDVSGCITTAATKDNLIAEIMEEPILIPEATAKGYAEATEGDSVNLEQPNSKTRRGRVGKQMANTLTTSCNQGVVVSEPKIIEVGFVKEGKHQQDYVQHEDGICRTICTGTHASTPHLLKTMVSVDTDTTIGLEPKIIEEPENVGYLEFSNFISLGTQNNSYNRVWKTDNYCGALNCTKQMEILDKQKMQYRIRKLTPRECFRLMGCDEETIDIIQAAGISNSQQYKLAGNSIVVACLEKIFEQMFFPQYTNSRTLFG